MLTFKYLHISNEYSSFFRLTGSLIVLPLNEFQMRDPKYQDREPVLDVRQAGWVSRVHLLTFPQAEQEITAQVLTIKNEIIVSGNRCH